MKAILIKGRISGKGCVNFDDAKSQKFNLAKLGITDRVGNDNVKLAKKAYFLKRDADGNVVTDENGEKVYDFKIKISAECLRNAIFRNDVECVNPMVKGNDMLASNYMLSPVGITRGYMFADNDKEGAGTLKRKSPLTVSDAIQTNDAKAVLEIGTTSGDRNPTSMFYYENVGDIEYEFEAIIDIPQLTFIVADQLFDRMAIKSDWIHTGLAEKMLSMHFPGISNPAFGYFTKCAECLSQEISEFGIILNKELVEHLVKYLLKNILGASVKRNTGYANVTSISIKEVNDIVTDKFDVEDGWKNISTSEEVDQLSFNIECPYTKSTAEQIERIKPIREAYEIAVKELIEKRKAEKNEKKAARAAKKNKSNDE